MAGQGLGQALVPAPDEWSTSHAEIKEDSSVESRHLLQLPHGATENCKHGATAFSDSVGQARWIIFLWSCLVSHCII